MYGERDHVLVELFGPFRAFGETVALPLSGEMPFSGLFDRLEERLGPAFTEKARGEHVTCILNNQVIDREGAGDPLVYPGDRVAFALLLGGG